MTLNREGREAVFVVDGHLPKSESEIDSCENGGIGSEMSLFHRVFAGVVLFVQS